jgi:hypothetical protein
MKSFKDKSFAKDDVIFLTMRDFKVKLTKVKGDVLAIFLFFLKHLGKKVEKVAVQINLWMYCF